MHKGNNEMREKVLIGYYMAMRESIPLLPYKLGWRHILLRQGY